MSDKHTGEDIIWKILDRHCGDIVGIDAEGYVHGGSDHPCLEVDNEPRDWMDEWDREMWRERQFLPEERRALADAMIGRWTRYREAAL